MSNTKYMGMPLPALQNLIEDDLPNVAVALNSLDSEFNYHGYDVLWAGAVGDNATDNSTAFNNAIISCSGVLYVPPGTYVFKTSITIPSYITLIFADGAYLSPDSGVSITINGGIQAGNKTIFTGSGSILGTPLVREVFATWFGADTTGSSDSQPAFQSWLAFIAQTSLNGQPLKGYCPLGSYRIDSTLDFSLAFTSTMAMLDIEFAFGATIFTTTALSQMIFLGTNDSYHMEHCSFRFPLINGTNVATSGLRFRNVQESFLFFPYISNINGSYGLECDQSGTPSTGVFNNQIKIGTISNVKGGAGFQIQGNSAAANNGFQGNVVIASYLLGSTVGLWVDSNGTGNNSQLNTFIIGCVESNSNGIVDNNNNNIYIIAASDANSSGGVSFRGTGTPFMIGNITDGATSEVPGRLINTNTVLGHIAESIPASGTAYTNSGGNTQMVTISGGTVTQIAIGTTDTGLISGTFTLQAGQAITITYSVAPTFTVFTL